MAAGRPSTTAFAAMGSRCEVTVVGGSAGLLAGIARRRVDELEQRWSRFIPSSELCALNRAAGAAKPVRLSSDTYLLLDHGVIAWKWTSGRFDPTVLHAMVDAGYDASFEIVRTRTSAPRRVASAAPGCDGIELDPVARTARLPRGVGIDPGGYGKGLAADLVVEALLDAGARGACVSMGGDVRAGGEPPDDGWRIGIANPLVDGDLITVVVLEDHGLATSNRLIRRWDGAEGDAERTHLLDPRSGRFAGGLISASVIAGQAWWAEVLAKVAMVDTAATRTVIPLLGGEGLYVDQDGEVTASASFGSFDQRAQAVSTLT
jgi:FAD:protein FMN transferase